MKNKSNGSSCSSIFIFNKEALINVFFNKGSLRGLEVYDTGEVVPYHTEWWVTQILRLEASEDFLVTIRNNPNVLVLRVKVI